MISGGGKRLSEIMMGASRSVYLMKRFPMDGGPDDYHVVADDDHKALLSLKELDVAARAAETEEALGQLKPNQSAEFRAKCGATILILCLKVRRASLSVAPDSHLKRATLAENRLS